MFQINESNNEHILCLILMQIEVSTIISQAGVTLSSLVSRTQDLVSKLKALHLDRHEFVCLKYLVLFNPGEQFSSKTHIQCSFCSTLIMFVLCGFFSALDVKSVHNRRQVEQTQERVNRALMEYTQQNHPGHCDKFGQLLLRLPEVRSISLQIEDYLYQRHLQGDLPCNSLLTEMLHTKHSWEDDITCGTRVATVCCCKVGTFFSAFHIHLSITFYDCWK